MFRSRGNKQKITGMEIPSLSRMKERAGARNHHVHFIAIVGLLMIDFIRFVKLNRQRSVPEQFSENGLAGDKCLFGLLN